MKKKKNVMRNNYVLYVDYNCCLNIQKGKKREPNSFKDIN